MTRTAGIGAAGPRTVASGAGRALTAGASRPGGSRRPVSRTAGRWLVAGTAASLAVTLPNWLPPAVVALRERIFTRVNGDEGIEIPGRQVPAEEFKRVYGHPVANGRSRGAGLSDLFWYWLAPGPEVHQEHLEPGPRYDDVARTTRRILAGLSKKEWEELVGRCTRHVLGQLDPGRIHQVRLRDLMMPIWAETYYELVFREPCPSVARRLIVANARDVINALKCTSLRHMERRARLTRYLLARLDRLDRRARESGDPGWPPLPATLSRQEQAYYLQGTFFNTAVVQMSEAMAHLLMAIATHQDVQDRLLTGGRADRSPHPAAGAGGAAPAGAATCPVTGAAAGHRSAGPDGAAAADHGGGGTAGGTADGAGAAEVAEDDDYLDRVIDETLRVWPLFGVAHRITTAELPRQDQPPIPAGSVLLFNYSGYQREGPAGDPEFDPDRWLDLDPKRAHFIPFGVTANRPCPARGFATLTMRVVAREVLRGFRLDSSAAHTRSLPSRGPCLLVPHARTGGPPHAGTGGPARRGTGTDAPGPGRHAPTGGVRTPLGGGPASATTALEWRARRRLMRVMDRWEGVPRSLTQLALGSYMVWDARRKGLCRTYFGDRETSCPTVR